MHEYFEQVLFFKDFSSTTTEKPTFGHQGDVSVLTHLGERNFFLTSTGGAAAGAAGAIAPVQLNY
jgi:hypothetical protein